MTTIRRVSAAQGFLVQLDQLKEQRQRVEDAILLGRRDDVSKDDVAPLMKAWITANQAIKSGDTVCFSLSKKGFLEEFEQLSLELEALGADLSKLELPAESKENYDFKTSVLKWLCDRPNLWKFIHPLAIALALLVAAFGDMEYSYYVLLRFMVCASFGWWAWLAHSKEKPAYRNAMALVAIFYNPFLPLGLEEEYWQAINLCTFVAVVVASVRIADYWRPRKIQDS